MDILIKTTYIIPQSVEGNELAEGMIQKFGKSVTDVKHDTQNIYIYTVGSYKAEYVKGETQWTITM